MKLKCDFCNKDFCRKPSEKSNRNFCTWICWKQFNLAKKENRNQLKIKNPKTDLSGSRFGKLVVLKQSKKYKSRFYWECLCDCGNITSVVGFSLENGNTKSCGCLRGTTSPECRKIKRAISERVRKSIRGEEMDLSCLPYTIEELKLHLESQWEPWMNWSNYGGKADEKRLTWWIDHIIPHSHFDYKSFDDPLFLKCWQLSNLRPLEKNQNIKKGSTFSQRASCP